MPFDLLTYGSLRPYLYHLTARSNLPRIRQDGGLESAASLAQRANDSVVIEAKRATHLPIDIDGERVMLRDQKPLHAANMRLEDGWTFERFIAHLNERVFFWPGRDSGPNDYGRRHFGRYETEKPVIVRVAFAGLVAANSQSVPLFARVNSGSPRWSGGAQPVRGSRTFVAADVAPFGAGDVVEVTFQGRVQLPPGAQVADSPDGAWSALVDA
ncbi:MAG TPA: hypothetical protein VGP25_06850 [Gemmatimonadaceae bacterium]|nr:hypothetical protein [Gemmatimonadaceae bacterium]